MAARNLTCARLREKLEYDPATGVFKWRDYAPAHRERKDRGGTQAGSVMKIGYIAIRLDKTPYYAHRLAWLYVHGAWPLGVMDHLNGDRTDNRIANLRDVSRQMNNQNLRTARANNALGVLGVRRKGRRFIAEIETDETKTAARFDTAEDAHAAYVEAKRRLHSGCTL